MASSCHPYFSFCLILKGFLSLKILSKEELPFCKMIVDLVDQGLKDLVSESAVIIRAGVISKFDILIRYL